MTAETPSHSRLVPVLQEGIRVIQMILFKELRRLYQEKYADKETMERSMLAGAVINALFGVENPEDKFQRFNRDNTAIIEQELFGFGAQFPNLLPYMTDALRVQALCDHQLGDDSTPALKQADELGILILDRDVPLPSVFMTRVRVLGEQYGLTVAPVQVAPEDDNLPR